MLKHVIRILLTNFEMPGLLRGDAKLLKPATSYAEIANLINGGSESWQSSLCFVLSRVAIGA